MTAPNRVDELRKRYHENPRRFFAPLANEYRKTGFIDRAILLCEKHLGEQPSNMNGLVVYGQCLFESGRYEEARGPFEGALALDPENLIALRNLGDIARLGGDHAVARDWYVKVLELDRRNDEVLALLEEVGGRESKEPDSGPSAAPNIVSVAPSVSVSSGMEALGMIDLGTADAPAVTPPPVPVTGRGSRAATPVDPSAKTVEVSAQTRPMRRASLLDMHFDFGEVPAAELQLPPVAAAPVLPVEAAEYGFAMIDAPIESAEPEPLLVETETSEVEPLSLEGAEPSDVEPLFEQSPVGERLSDLPAIEGLEAAEFSADVAPLADLESMEFQAEEVSTLPDLEPAEFQAEEVSALEDLEPAEFSAMSVESAPVDGLEIGDFAPPPVDVDHDLGEFLSLDALGTEEEVAAAVPESEFEVPPAAPEPEVGTPSRVPSLEEAETIEIDLGAERERMETPAAFVTETMAQLYVRQGLVDQAILVYRQLVEQSPDDSDLRARLLALEEPEPPSLGFGVPGVDDVVAEPPPPNAMLSEVSFAEVSLVTPPPVEVAPEPTGPSAREFLGTFARRAATPVSTPAVSGAPSVGGSSISPLDAVFGSAVSPEDERAAHRLAAVGATSGPSGGSALDSVFGEGPSAPMPEELIAGDARSAVPRASDKLRFDQFFSSSLPTEEEPSASVPDAEDAPEAGDGGGGDELPSDDDDLDQFQGWLRGLTE